MNKQSILEKVAVGVELTPAEVKYLQSVLSDAPECAVQTDDNVQFNHQEPNTFAACGISEEDFEDGNGEIAKILFLATLEVKTKSEIIEKFLTEASPKTKHLFMVKAICDLMK